MVLLVDLDEDESSSLDARNDHLDAHETLRYLGGTSLHLHHGKILSTPSDLPIRPNPNLNSMTASFSCYPVISQLATHLSLNDLHALSLTCRQIHANISPYRQNLKTLTLRCINDPLIPYSVPGIDFSVWNSYGSHTSWRRGRYTKYARCARDLVAGCRRCGLVVCRNCTSKPPPARDLPIRHRRLCRTCLAVPLEAHTLSFLGASHLTDCSSPSTPNLSSSPLSLPLSVPETPEFTSAAFARTPCKCATDMHLCAPCGHFLHTADTMYLRVWRWRTRYANLGGLGTGIGEGNEGVKCGRGAECIAATEVEVEVDIDDVRPSNTHTSSSSTSASSSKSSTSSDTSMNGAVTDDEEEAVVKGPIYGTHEIEGIGGVVRRKAIKKVRIGACVEELEDEREGRCDYMARETSGEERSWCAWCWRIIPRNGELANRA